MTDVNILIVEDEKKLAQVLADYLAQDNYQSHCLYEGGAVIPWLKRHSVDLILLDIMLPGKDGMSLCREIREFSKVPIMMMTAKVEEIDRLLGLELGADDYICKPYSPREVIARIKAVLRRCGSIQPAFEQLNLDEGRLRVVYQGNSIELTAVEFKLLKKMAVEPGRIFSRAQLMESMYSDHRIVSDRTIDSHIKKIRKKCLQLSSNKAFIHAVYGAGYRLDIIESEDVI